MSRSEKFWDSIVKWTSLFEPSDSNTNTVDPRRENILESLSNVIQGFYAPDVFIEKWPCIVANVREYNGLPILRPDANSTAIDYNILNQTSMPNESQEVIDKIGENTEKTMYIYKLVHLKGLDARSLSAPPRSSTDWRLLTYPDILASRDLADLEPFAVNSLVNMVFDDPVNLRRPKIIEYLGPIAGGWEEELQGLLSKWKSPEGKKPAYLGPTPEADKLRDTLKDLGIEEKANQLTSGGDLTAAASRAAAAVLKQIRTELPNLKIRVTGGNDLYHQNLKYNSRHKTGDAVDFTVEPNDPAMITAVEKILQRFAAGNNEKFRYLNEYAEATAEATGAHFHISWGLGTEAGNELEAALALAESGDITPIEVS